MKLLIALILSFSLVAKINGGHTGTERKAPVENSPTAIQIVEGGVIQNSPAAIQNSPGTISQSPAAIQTAPGTIENSPATIQNSPGNIENSPGVIQTVPGNIENSPAGVQNPATGDVMSPVPGANTPQAKCPTVKLPNCKVEDSDCMVTGCPKKKTCCPNPCGGTYCVRCKK